MAEIASELRDVKGKIVVVTGGTSGIGLSIVKHMLNREAKYVAVFELDNEDSRSVFEELQNQYLDGIGFYPCDVTKTDMISENFDKVVESHKTIDILVNNAGIGGEDKPELIMDINLKAVVLASYMLIDRIGKHKGGRGGVIVNVASVLGIVSVRAPVYSATKHGVVSFTRILQGSYDVTGVRVFAICPSYTKTRILKTALNNNLDFLKVTNVETLQKLYLQSPDSVAKAVVDVIEKGEREAIWVVKRDEPAYPVEQKEDLKDFV